MAFAEDNVPIGAVLTIDGLLVGKSHNKLYTNQNWVSYAETLLIYANGTRIRTARKEGKTIELYTTLDPCSTCFGTSAMN